MKDLAVIQADDALVDLKRDQHFKREYYTALPNVDDRRRYAAQFLDEHQIDCMSPAGWRVLDAYLQSDR